MVIMNRLNPVWWSCNSTNLKLCPVKVWLEETKQKLDHYGQVDAYLRIVVKKFGNETFLMLLLKLYIFKSGSFTVSFSLFSSFLYSSIKKCSLSMKFSDGWFKIRFLWCQLRPPANCATIKAVCITDKNEWI